jgi:hypothetical protein
MSDTQAAERALAVVDEWCLAHSDRSSFAARVALTQAVKEALADAERRGAAKQREGKNMEKNVWVELSPMERTRTYQYGENEAYCFANVRRIKVSDSGHHYLETDAGKKYIMAPGWHYLEIDADEWTR